MITPLIYNTDIIRVCVLVVLRGEKLCNFQGTQIIDVQ